MELGSPCTSLLSACPSFSPTSLCARSFVWRSLSSVSLLSSLFSLHLTKSKRAQREQRADTIPPSPLSTSIFICVLIFGTFKCLAKELRRTLTRTIRGGKKAFAAAEKTHGVPHSGELLRELKACKVSATYAASTPWLCGTTACLGSQTVRNLLIPLGMLGDVGDVGVPLGAPSETSPEPHDLLLPWQPFACLISSLACAA